MRPDLESSHHSQLSHPNLLEFAHFDFLASHSNFKILNKLRDQKEHFGENKLYHVNQGENKQNKGGGHTLRN